MTSLRKRIAFFSDLKRASSVYRVPYSVALLRSFSLYSVAKFSFKEILGYGLFVPSMAAKFPVLISKERSLMPLEAFNPRHMQHLTENKDEFHQICVRHGLPIPETYGWTKNGQRYAADSSLIDGDAAWANYLAACLPGDFIVKDRAGAYGSGFMAFRRLGTMFRPTEGVGSYDINGLISLISPANGMSEVIIQKRLFDAPLLSELSGRRGLQTMRVTTLLEKDGQVSILFYMVKILAGTHDSDNFSMGTSGNLVAYGDRDVGCLRGALNIHQCGSGIIRVAAHPVTGTSFDGFRLPFWQEAIDLVKTGQQCFPVLPTLGWDIALTKDGPRIIEANSRWDPPLYAPFLMLDADWHRIFSAQ